jgi:hypothetical protein
MKKLLILGTAAMLVSTSVFATQARLLALGMKETDNEGMYYIEDGRNIFLNSAYVNLYPDQVVAEWGSFGVSATLPGGVAGTSDATLGRSSAPKAQGGVFKKIGDLVFGAYMGNESNTSSLLRVAGTSAFATTNALGAGTTNSKMLRTADNQLDLFVGGDAGLKWGANVSYGQGKDESAKAKDSAAAVRLGVIGTGWDAHLNLSVNNKSKRTDTITSPLTGNVPTVVSQEFEGKFGAQLGGSLVVSGNNRVFGYVKHYGWDQTDSFNGYPVANIPTGPTPVGGQNGTVKGDFTSYYLGWGSHFDVTGSDRIYTSVSAKKTDINLKFTNKGEIRHLVIPVTIGYEVVAAEWLTLRGSLIQNLWGQRDNKNMQSINPVARGLIAGIYGGNGKRTLPNSTEVNAGATLTFGQLSVDGLIGLTNGNRTTAANTTNGTVQEVNQGVLALDNLASSVAVTYKF